MSNTPFTAWIAGVGFVAPGLPDWPTARAVLRGEQAIGNEAAQGSLFTNATDALKNPASAEAVKVLGEKGIPPEAFTLNAYAAVEVLKAGIEKAGKADDTAAVAAALKSGEPISTAMSSPVPPSNFSPSSVPTKEMIRRSPFSALAFSPFEV